MSVILNKQQTEAVNNFNHDLLVTAGAGTGKTRVLTYKYLSLLKELHLEVPQIVAVTFTKKAADEMRVRIREGIKNNIVSSLQTERGFWLRQLEALEASSHISTIHGLCYSILTEHPVESGLNPGAEVMDEGEVHLLQREAAKEALNILLAGTNGHEAAKVLLEQGVGFFTQELVGIYPTVRESGKSWSEIRRLSEENLVSALPELSDCRMDIKVKFCQLVEEFMATAKSLNKITPKAKERLDELEAGWKQAKISLSAAKYFDEDLNTQLTWILSLLPRNTVKELKDPTNEVHDCAYELKRTFSTKTAAGHLPIIMEYLQLFDDEYQKMKRLSGKIDFGDQQILTRDLLVKYPEFARDYHDRFAYFLIDEVQDTNNLQWEILSKIIYSSRHIYAQKKDEEVIGEKKEWQNQDSLEHAGPFGANINNPHGRGAKIKGRVFLVGDIKQSIYRFRGAEVEVITELASDFNKGNGRTIALEENYRTQWPVAEVINELCKRIFSSENYPYHPLVAARNREEGMKSRVELLIANEEGESEPQVLAARIKELVENEEVSLKTAAGERRARYGDIALLFRTTTNIRAYEEAFRRLRIPFLVNVGTGFYSRQEIQDQMSLLRLVENKMDSLALAEVLRAPFCGLSDNELFWLAHPDGLIKGFYGDDPPNQVEDKIRKKLLYFRNLLQNWQENIHLLSITDLLRMAMEETGYLAVTGNLPDGERRLANLEKFLNRARDFVRKGYSGVREFVTFIEQLTTLSVREGEAPVGKEDDVVQMMTVHAAKGLEFPVVVLPELGHRFNVSRTSPVFFHKKLGFAHKVLIGGANREETFLTEKIKENQKREEISELKRLFYVALTRAEDYLLLSGRLVKKKMASSIDEAGSWLEWIYQIIPDLSQIEAYAVSELTWAGQRIRLTWGDPYLSDDSNAISQVSLDRFYEESEITESAAAQEGMDGKEEMEKETAATAWNYALPRRWQGRKECGRPKRVALSPLLTFMQCPRRFYWEHRLGTNGEYVEVNEPQIINDYPKPTGVILGEVFHRLVAESRPGIVRAIEKEKVEPYFSTLSKEKKSGVLSLLEAMYRNYLQSPFLPQNDVEVFNEYPFLLHIDKVAIKGTIDRILIYPEGDIKVVDFKTNKRVPEDSLLKEYLMQISVYALAIEEIFGKRPDEAWIYFVCPNRIIPCPLETDRLSAVREEILKVVEFVSNHDRPEDYVMAEKCGTCPFISYCGTFHSS